MRGLSGRFGSWSRRGPLGVGVLVAALSFSGCTSTQLAGQSPAYLIIDAVTAASGAKPTEFGGTLASDVLTNGGIFADNGRATFRLALKDPGSADTPLRPTSANFITVNRYHVRFMRTDGRNTQGVDVPYAFDGAVTATVTDTVTPIDLVLVRVQAKLEAPLRALAGLGGAVAISTIAEITFYGADQAGHEVSATGYVSVNFADWADPD